MTYRPVSADVIRSPEHSRAGDYAVSDALPGLLVRDRGRNLIFVPDAELILEPETRVAIPLPQLLHLVIGRVEE